MRTEDEDGGEKDEEVAESQAKVAQKSLIADERSCEQRTSAWWPAAARTPPS